jgi:inhibitor of KinA
MPMSFAYTVFPLGDAALTIDFGNTIDEALNGKVLRLFYRLQAFSPFIKDIVPAYSSLTVYYDVASLRTKEASAFEAMKAIIEPFLREEENTGLIKNRQVKIPVCYAKKFAPDMDELAAQKNLSVEEVIGLHTARIYRVFMIGFLPGFAYMGKIDEKIGTPRRSQPRTNVPAGSVGIAGEQTGIYPLASPGGWNIIGRTPLKLFDANRKESVLLQPGDELKFYAITEDEFENYQSRNA